MPTQDNSGTVDATELQHLLTHCYRTFYPQLPRSNLPLVVEGGFLGEP